MIKNERIDREEKIDSLFEREPKSYSISVEVYNSRLLSTNEPTNLLILSRRKPSEELHSETVTTTQMASGSTNF